MKTHTDSADIVIVGGGIAGSALALVLANAGLGVTVLERQAHYQDRVRGEVMAPWGVAEAQQLGILDALHNAGGVYVQRSISYDEVMPPDVAEAHATDLTRILPGVPGPYCAGHPVTCQALSDAAQRAGARYVQRVGRTQVIAGRKPGVAYELDGTLHRLAPRLVVGADGRTSTVRSQVGIPLHRAEATHLKRIAK
jgi:2-polyprenyl-6-methoxyphenol hydroxylase-like FAD-dependent oxidoreductase